MRSFNSQTINGCKNSNGCKNRMHPFSATTNAESICILSTFKSLRVGIRMHLIALNFQTTMTLLTNCSLVRDKTKEQEIYRERTKTLPPQNEQIKPMPPESNKSKEEEETTTEKKTKKKMDNTIPVPSSYSSSSLRWRILRQAFLSRNPSPSPPSTEEEEAEAEAEAEEDTISQMCVNRISRKTSHGFNLIHSQLIMNQHQHTAEQEEEEEENNHGRISKDVYVSYTLPLDTAPKLVMSRRVENFVNLNDFEICNRYDIDNTGLVCHWPSEEVLAYFCLSHAHMFRSKRILELGAGYGLAGLVIAASTDALEVLISDGNPQVVDYIQRNIHANSTAFADTKVKSTILHWNQEPDSKIVNTFDIIVASDCTFFKEFHTGLAQTVKSLLKHSEASEAIFLSPKRGNSLDKFLEKINEIGLHFSIKENYDKEVWCRHQKFLNGDESWPNYEKDHSYPMLLVLTDVVDNGVLVFERHF